MGIEVTPGQRITAMVNSGHPDSGQHLLEYLSEHGAEDIDVQALATKIVEDINEGEWDEE
jgi:hypothetical protein